MIRRDRTIFAAGWLTFDADKAVDAIRYHIVEIRGVRDFIGSEQLLRRLADSRKSLRVSARIWSGWKDIDRLLWLLSETDTSYQVNRQNVAVLMKTAPRKKSSDSGQEQTL